jgi:hypothetical protein
MFEDKAKACASQDGLENLIGEDTQLEHHVTTALEIAESG